MWAWLAEQIAPYLPAHAARLETRLTNLEHRMALTDEALADLDVATTEVAEELDELHGRLAALDSDLAARIHEKADRLRALAADPENPVPDLVPQTPAPTPPPVMNTGSMDEPQSGTSGVAGIGS